MHISIKFLEPSFNNSHKKCENANLMLFIWVLIQKTNGLDLLHKEF